jgi:phthiodiolone/phenolphthiodiolone dimycocerosates ketoreductase
VTESRIGTGVLLWSDRYAPTQALPDMFRACERSGVIDQAILTDQASHFIPPPLWSPENAPLATIHHDPDSMDSPFLLMGYCLREIERMEVGIMCDVIRHGPSELTQMMLTLANLSNGRATLHIGAGEMKNISPYGWKRARALEKLEDFFKIFTKFMEEDGPIDFEGNFWKLKQARLGGGKPYRPRLWGMGGGPRLLDLATTYADGISVATPNSWNTPEKAASQIVQIKAALEQKGRDPEAFTFGIDCPSIIHDDPEVLSRALRNPMVRYLSGVHGRINSDTWRDEGIESAVADGWAYYLHYKPQEITAADVEDVLSRVTPEITRRSWFVGSPEEVADQLQAYIDVGVTWVAPCDYMPMVAELDDLPDCLPRTFEVCARLKARNPLYAQAASLAGPSSN